LRYELPPSQEKLSLGECTVEKVANSIFEKTDTTLDKAMLSTVMGVSPVVCRELAFLSAGMSDKPVSELSTQEKLVFVCELEKLMNVANNHKGRPYMLMDSSGKPFDVSFINIKQYDSQAQCKEYESFCELLDDYYYRRDSIERMRMRSRDLAKLMSNNIGRLSRKLSAQMAELEKSQDREQLRINADLLQANLYRIEKGAASVQVENFYDENMSLISIKLDPAKTPAQNAQKYYKDYAKAKTADKMLRLQIEKGKQELEYLETVADEIDRAESEKDLSQIRLELVSEGYIKQPKGKQKPPAQMPAMEFMVSDGFKILVGRNNRQNDTLTLKTARNSDLWFHTKDIPGSHTIMILEGREATEAAIMDAARICAWYSKARESSQVPVDYTFVRYVSKPQGSPPGRVIYTDQHTVYVTPKEPDSAE